MGQSKVDLKSTATLIDELTTTNLKIFWALEKANKAARKKKKKRKNTQKVGEFYGMAQRLNSRRSQLIVAIDERLGEDSSSTEKTF